MAELGQTLASCWPALETTCACERGHPLTFRGALRSPGRFPTHVHGWFRGRFPKILRHPTISLYDPATDDRTCPNPTWRSLHL